MAIDPMANHQPTLRAIRYIELAPRDMATVTIACLRRLGRFEEGMAARHLDEQEIMLLTNADFRGVK